MKKIVIFFAAALLSVSCVIVDSQKRNFTQSFRSYGLNLVYRTATISVEVLNSIYFVRNADLFRSEIDTLIGSSSNWIKITSSQDSSLTVVGNEDVKWSATAVLATESEGNPIWDIELVGNYEEGNGYSASIVTDGPVRFSWKKNTYNTSVRYEVVQSGKYCIKTFINGTLLDSVWITYKDGQYFY